MAHKTSIERSRVADFMFSDTRLSWLWLVIRLYLAYEWFSAGIHKVTDPAWVGSDAGPAIMGFLNGALAKTGGAHPAVQSWYGWFIENIAIPNHFLLSHLVAFGEVFVALGLFLGVFTGLAAFFGATMNFNFLFAGTTSINPQLLILEILLILAWRTAGWIGADRYILPWLDKKCRSIKK